MDSNWRVRAACRDVNPDLMFPEDRDADGKVAAREVCRRCPVSRDCLEDAMADPDPNSGMRGGLTHRQRQGLARRRDGTTAPPPATPARPRRTRVATHTPPAAPRPPGRTAVLVAPEVLQRDGVRVDDDRTVTLDDRAWLVVRLTLQRFLDDQTARAASAAHCFGGGQVRLDHRDQVCGVLHKLGHGIGWKSLPATYGESSKIRKLHRRLVVSGHWPALVEALGPYTPDPLPADRLVA